MIPLGDAKGLARGGCDSEGVSVADGEAIGIAELVLTGC